MIRRQIKTEHNKSFFLFGPRGTGKTSWLKSEYPDSLVINLLEQRIFAELIRNPDDLATFILPQHRDRPIIIDEVQKIPELLDVVHNLIESQKLHFILTGSSPRKLKKGGANLLAGRARTREMHPFTATELGDLFRLKHSLQFGHLPSVYTQPDPADYLKSYVGTYLREEVQNEAITRNLSVFFRFLETATFSQGSMLSVLNVAQECGIDRNTAEAYFQALEDLLIAVRIPVFTKRAKRKLVAQRKFYYFDVGVFQSLRPRGPLDTDAEIAGASLESLVFQELRAHNSFHQNPYSLHFWRTTYGDEVDFVLYGEPGLHAIEVKTGSRITQDDLKSLRLFREDYPMANVFLVYGGQDQRVVDGIHLVPAEIFLKKMILKIFK